MSDGDERVEGVIEGIAERRAEEDRAGRPGLVLVVEELGVPFDDRAGG